MIDFNNNNKFMPTAPKTYTVSELRDTQQPFIMTLIVQSVSSA
jgi:hypothetical protein